MFTVNSGKTLPCLQTSQRLERIDTRILMHSMAVIDSYLLQGIVNMLEQEYLTRRRQATPTLQTKDTEISSEGVNAILTSFISAL